MAAPMGQSVLTYDGVMAYQAAALTGSTVKPAYFKFSEADLLDPAAHDLPDAWIQLPITAYLPIDRDTVEYICECPPEAAEHFCRTCGLFLENGTLIMLARPPYPFPPALRQRFRIQFRFGNVQALTDFVLIPYDQVEHDLAMLDLAATLGQQLLANSSEVGLLRGMVADLRQAVWRRLAEVARQESDLAADLAALRSGVAADLAALEESLGLEALAIQVAHGEQILANGRAMGLLRTAISRNSQ